MNDLHGRKGIDSHGKNRLSFFCCSHPFNETIRVKINNNLYELNFSTWWKLRKDMSEHLLVCLTNLLAYWRWIDDKRREEEKKEKNKRKRRWEEKGERREEDGYQNCCQILTSRRFELWQYGSVSQGQFDLIYYLLSFFYSLV